MPPAAFVFSSLYRRRPSAPKVEISNLRIGWYLRRWRRAWTTWVLPKLPSELWLALKLVKNWPWFRLKPKSKISTGEPSTKAAVLDCWPSVYERRLLWTMLSRPAAARVLVPAPAPPYVEALVVLLALSYFIVLRALSLFRRSSSTVFPFLTAKRLTKPWYLSMSATCKLIYFWSTTSSLSIWIFKLWRAVSIFASNWIISFF